MLERVIFREVQIQGVNISICNDYRVFDIFRIG